MTLKRVKSFQTYKKCVCHFFSLLLYASLQVTGELSDGSGRLIDPTKNKYEVASQLIIHLLMAASAGDETALKW